MLKTTAQPYLKVFVRDFVCVCFDNCSDLWRKWFDLCESAGANEHDRGCLKRMCEGDVMQELFAQIIAL